MKIEVQQAVLRSRLEIYQAMLESFTGNIDNELGQLAAAAKLRIGAMQSKRNQCSDAEIQVIQEMLGELIRGLQNISSNSYLICLSNIDLVGAMEMEISRISHNVFNTSISFSVNGSMYSFAIDKTIILFRSCQHIINELITQELTSLSVSLKFDPANVSIWFSIAGNICTTFFQGEVLDRAQLVGIKIHIENNPGHNTNIIILDVDTKNENSPE